MSQADKKNTMAIFANNLNEMMKLKSKSRKDICDELNIKYTTFCDWVNGKTYPRVEAIESLAEYFGINVGDFFIEYDSQNANSKDRYEAYAEKLGVWDMDTINKLSDKQITELVKSGIGIRHKTLEEYIDEQSSGVMVPSSEIAWGNKIGDEIW